MVREFSTAPDAELLCFVPTLFYDSLPFFLGVFARYISPHVFRSSPRICCQLCPWPGCFNAGFDCGVVDSGVVGGGGGGGFIDFSIPPVVYGKNPVASFRPLASQCFNGGLGCGVMDVSACTLGGDSGSDGATTSDPGVTTTDSTTPLDDDTSAATTSDRALPTTTDTADSDTPTSSGTPPCQAEANACLADPECTLCIDALDAEEAAIEAICEASDYSEETATCSERSEVMCCYVEEGTDCIVTNAAMVAYVGGWSTLLFWMNCCRTWVIPMVS